MTEQDSEQPSQPGPGPRKKSPGILKIMQSILAGAFGVQSSRRHQEDFESHSPWPYIIAGILFTLGFIAALALLVQWVLSG